MEVPKCPTCSQPIPTALSGLVAATVAKPATLAKRSDAASQNEMATDLEACEPERFDEATGPMERMIEDAPTMAPLAEDFAVSKRDAYGVPRGQRTAWVLRGLGYRGGVK